MDPIGYVSKLNGMLFIIDDFNYILNNLFCQKFMFVN